MEHAFPIYRKYPNNKSFFKILDGQRFIEVKLTGSAAEQHRFQAKILPDRNFIADMLNLEGGYWVKATEKEFENALSLCP